MRRVLGVIAPHRPSPTGKEARPQVVTARQRDNGTAPASRSGATMRPTVVARARHVNDVARRGKIAAPARQIPLGLARLNVIPVRASGSPVVPMARGAKPAGVRALVKLPPTYVVSKAPTSFMFATREKTAKVRKAVAPKAAVVSGETDANVDVAVPVESRREVLTVAGLTVAAIAAVVLL